MASEIRYLCDTCHQPIEPTDKWELDVATDQMWHSRCPKPAAWPNEDGVDLLKELGEAKPLYP